MGTMAVKNSDKDCMVRIDCLAIPIYCSNNFGNHVKLFCLCICAASNWGDYVTFLYPHSFFGADYCGGQFVGVAITTADAAVDFLSACHSAWAG